MNGWAIKDGNGEIDIGSLQETFEDAWDEWLQGRQITTQKGAEAEGYTCVYVVIQEAGSGEVLQLPPLTDLMYHAVRGSEYHFSSGGTESVIGYLDDDCLDEIWDNINTALRCAQVKAHPPASAGMVSNEALNIAQAVVKTVDVDGLGKYTHPDQAHLVLFARELLRLAAAKGRP